MTHFRDGSQYTDHDSRETLIAAGWLDDTHHFDSGPVGETYEHFLFCDRLFSACRNRVVALMRGFHTCQLCSPGTDRDTGEPGQVRHELPTMLVAERHGEAARLGNGEIHAATSDGERWGAPTLVYHYVVEHGYRPPAAFVEAVVNGRIEAPAPSPIGATRPGDRLGELADLDQELADQFLALLSEQLDVPLAVVDEGVRLVVHAGTRVEHESVSRPVRFVHIKPISYPAFQTLVYDGTDSWRAQLAARVPGLARHVSLGNDYPRQK